MTHPALQAGRAAVVTGAASGIGLAACKRFAELGMKVVMSDIAPLDAARDEVASIAKGGTSDVLTAHTDVASIDDLARLRDTVLETFGHIGVLMNNAVTRQENTTWTDHGNWQRTIDVNLWAVINGVHTFLPSMLEQEGPSLVINCGSKQGITNPPKNPAYNMTKAALKSYTESLQHELRNTQDCAVTAHLLVPGWTTTGNAKHVPGAWLPAQVVAFMLSAVENGDFYIICPDDEVTPEMDRQRILWAAGDITENRPPLSRWHPDFAKQFKETA